MTQKNLFPKNAKLTSLHFWNEEKSFHVITDNVKKAQESMGEIYPGIIASVATGQPNEPQENQIQFKFNS